MAIKHLLLVACAFRIAAPSQDTPAFRASVELVEIPCTVVDGKGTPVRDLTREEFRVLDNGAPRIVDHLWQDTDLPLTLGVIIDASASQEAQSAEHQQTVLALLEQILKPDDRVFVVSVDE